jgi:hypothetical protein
VAVVTTDDGGSRGDVLYGKGSDVHRGDVVMKEGYEGSKEGIRTSGGPVAS